MIGKLLDHRYQVIRVLATGGFGQTYIAQDTRRPGNPVCVVKHLKPANSDPKLFDTAKRLFHSEAETLEHLGNHDQIPRLLAYFDENQEFYLVQEFIAGPTLGEELIPTQRWNENQVLQLLQEVLGVLEFVHSQGVIHRDIKPDNIIRRSSDNKFVLVDFGAVKQLRTQLVSVGGQPTATVVIGTPGYMPTEQGQGKPRPNSDIYSLGIIAIQALTGVPAAELPEDTDTGEILWEHLLPGKSRLAPVLTKMVRYHFKDRYQTATEALQACREAMNLVAASSLSPASSKAKNITYPAAKSPSQLSPQKTIAVAPANPAIAKSRRQDASRPDPLPLLVGILLAGGAAALVTNFYPNVKNLVGNLTGELPTAKNKCSAVVVGNSNIRSEPIAMNSDNVVQTVGDDTKFEVTGKRTKGGWIELKRNSRNLAWAHSDVINNNQEMVSCLRSKGIAIKIVDDSSLIATRPVAKVKPKSSDVVKPTPEKLEPFNSQPFTTDADKSNPDDHKAKTLEAAKEKYESGDLEGAIALLKSIPGNAASSFKETAIMIAQWQQDWAKADALFNDINQALEQGEWDKVLDYQKNPEKLPNIQYWQKKLEPLFQQAAENIAKQALPQIEKQKRQNNSQPDNNQTEEPDSTETPAKNL